LSPVSEVTSGYARALPVFRERLPTLELLDEDLVEEPPPSRAAPPVPMRRADPKLRAVDVSNVVPLRAPQRGARRAIDPHVEAALDQSAALFEILRELDFVESAWQAASICAASLGRALGARAVMIHTHDRTRRELRTIGVHGTSTDLLGASGSSDDDFVAATVLCNETPMTMRLDGGLPRVAPCRLGIAGASRTLVAVPAMAAGRCIALIEVIDADERWSPCVAATAAYVAERLAEFLSSPRSRR
jgi:hypothetical protein